MFSWSNKKDISIFLMKKSALSVAMYIEVFSLLLFPGPTGLDGAHGHAHDFHVSLFIPFLIAPGPRL